jgi:hypothetical protein
MCAIRSGRGLALGVVLLLIGARATAGGQDVVPVDGSAGVDEAATRSSWRDISQQAGFAGAPAVAYNPSADEFLVVWSVGDIFGQRIDAKTGAEVGENDFRISEMLRGAYAPDVAFDTLANQYLVVWVGDDYPIWSARQVYGQLLTADGVEAGPEFLIAGGPPEPFTAPCGMRLPVTCYPSQFPVTAPAVTFNPESGEYLVVFHSSSPYPADFGVIETIGASRIGGSGAMLGGSGVTQLAGPCCAISSPAVAHTAKANQYLVVWTEGYQVATWRRPNVFGRRLDATATPLGAAFTISAMSESASRPAVAYNGRTDEFLVVWEGRHATLPLNASQIFGQRISSAGIPVGADDFRISNASSSYEGMLPDIACNEAMNEYLVVWRALRQTTIDLAGQRVDALGVQIGPNDFSISGPVFLAGERPAVVFDSTHRKYLAVGAETLGSQARWIFGRQFRAPPSFIVGLGQNGGGELQVWTQSPSGGAAPARIALPWPAYSQQNGELHPVHGDIDGDTLDELIVGLGSGGHGWIALFDDVEHGHALLGWIQVPWPWYNAASGAVWPAAGDLDGDGTDEIVAGLGPMGQGYLAIFDGAARGYALRTWRRADWPWYNAANGETHPAIVDVDGAGGSEIVIGFGAGGGGWLQVLGDAGTGFRHLRWLRIGWSLYAARSGETYPAGGNLDRDKPGEIVVGLGPGSDGWVEFFDDAQAGMRHKEWLQVSWPGYTLWNGESHPAVGDVDGDPALEIVLGLGVYPGRAGYFEVRDDDFTGYESLGWHNVAGPEPFARLGATYPAVPRR